MNAIWMNTEHANILVCYQLYSPELMYIQDRIERCKFDFFLKKSMAQQNIQMSNSNSL